MFLLGILAFLQITVIPGAIILKASNFRGSIIQQIIYGFALSLITTYLIVFFLTAIHLYNQIFVMALLGCEFLGLLRLYKNDLQTPIFEVLQYQVDSFRNTMNAILLPDSENTSSNASLNTLSVLLRLVLLVFAFAGVLWTGRIFIGNLLSVFDAWDTVVSWNRWALDWASGQIPLDSLSYPHLIPANWSLTYVLIGNTVVQTFAKGIMPLFAVSILLSLFDLGLGTRSIGFFIGGIFTQLLLKDFFAEGITNGYVDVAVAFFALLAIHALIEAGNTNDASRSNQYLLWGAVFAAGAGVTKQPGLYIFALYPVLAYIHVIRHTNQNLKELKKYLIPFVLVSLIPLSWYILKQIHYTLNLDVFYVQEYFDVTSDTYGNVDRGEQIIAALSSFGNYLILFVFIIVGFPLLSSIYRALTIFIIIPYPIIWAWVASYDTRNLAIFIPIFALTAGMALQDVYISLIKKLDRTNLLRLKTRTFIAFLLVAMILGSLAIPSEKLLEQQTRLRTQIFSPSKNERIYALIEQDGPDTKIITNYPIRFLPGLENNQIQFGFQNFNTFITLVEDPETGYILYSNRAADKIKSYIDEKIDSGDYELVFIDREWIPYKMVRIIRR